MLGGLYVSLPETIGFIAALGVAVLNGVVLVSYINDLRKRGLSLRKAAVQEAELRLRPVLMTALTTATACGEPFDAGGGHPCK